MLFWISVFSRLKLMPNTINFVLSRPKCTLNSLSINQSNNFHENFISHGDKFAIQFSKLGKKVLKENQSDSSNLVLLDHQFLKNNRTLGIEKMNYKDIYSIIISSKVHTLTSRI